MIRFMVIAAPRSATTWASNWLTTDTTLCLHDPLFTHHYTELDELKSDRMLGISCTGIAMFPDWVNAHPARKVVLHRERSEINKSLQAIGLPPLGKEWEARLENIQGMHCDWRDVFDRPQRIYEYLLRRSMDWGRHTLLSEINVQPQYSRLHQNKAVGKRLIAELTA